MVVPGQHFERDWRVTSGYYSHLFGQQTASRFPISHSAGRRLRVLKSTNLSCYPVNGLWEQIRTISIVVAPIPLAQSTAAEELARASVEAQARELVSVPVWARAKQ
jgi:hypothetical protein